MFQRISTTAARELIRSRDPIILDTRDTHSYNLGHIPDAVHFDSRALHDLLRRVRRERPLLIYCYHGNASQDHARLLSNSGFGEVYSLDGGYQAWFAESGAASASLAADDLAAWMEREGFAVADVDKPNGHGVSPLIRACQLGLPDRAEALLAAGADIAALDAHGNDALWAACYSESLECIALLHDAGADLDRRNPSGATALIYAASAGKTEVVAFLLESGADPALQTLDDFTALDLAANAEILRLLKPARRAAPRRCPTLPPRPWRRHENRRQNP